MSFTLLTAEFQHESNTFSRRPTDIKAFQDRFFMLGEAALAERGDSNTALAGLLDVARPAGWRLHHAVSAGATPAGPVTRAAFDHIAGLIVDAAAAHRAALNGIFLGLHGAMVAEHLDDGEGELLARLRAVVGDELPIAITLDPHAIVTDRMTRLAQIIVAYKTYPHVDMRERGRQAGEILGRVMAGEIRPVTLCVRLPMLEEVSGGRTDIGPMIPRLDQARALERLPDIFAVSVNGGFGNADVAETGPTVLATCQGDLTAHNAAITAIAADIWQRRHETVSRYLDLATTAAHARDVAGNGKPLVIADYADNPGGGAYGDSTALLAALLDAKVADACLGGLVDPAAVAELERHQVGDTVTLDLGGKTDPAIGGGPLRLTGTLRHLSDGSYVGDGPMVGGQKGSFGPTAVLRVDDIDILVISNAAQILDLAQFRAFGIEPTARRVVAVKSMQHFRAAFEPIAAEVIVCDSGALCTPDLTKLPFRKVPRPIFPLDPKTGRM